MGRTHRAAWAFIFAALSVSACSVERGGLAVSDLGMGIDAGQLDLGMRDLAMADLAMLDLGPMDLGQEDLGREDLGPPDLGPPDLGPRDLGPPDLGPRDLGPPDLGPPDLGPPDLGPPDLGPPDLGPPDLGPPPSCDSLYMSATAYQLCAERATECEFSATLSGSNCGALCTRLGGTCIAAYDNGGPPCTRIPATGDTCSTNRSNEICVCSR